MRPRPLSLSFVSTILGLAFLLASGAGLVLVAGNRSLVRMGEWVFDSQEVVRDLNVLVLHLNGSEATIALQILTGGEETASDLALARDEVEQALIRLHLRLQNFPARAAKLEPLQVLVKEHFRSWEQVMTNGPSAGQFANRVEVDNALNHPRLHHIENLIEEIEADAMAELQVQTAAVVHRANWNDRLGLMALGASLALAAGTATFIFLRLRRLTSILTVCSWTHRVKVGDEWVDFQDYLGREFGLVVTHGMSEEAARAFESERPSSSPPIDPQK